MTSMKNVQFLHPRPPIFCLSEWVRIRQDTPTHTHLDVETQATTPPPPYPIPFGILAAYRLYLVDVSITYHAHATHYSLQLKINLN